MEQIHWHAYPQTLLTHQHPSKPIRTPSQPINTHQNPVRTHLNPTKTHQNPSKLIKPHQTPSKSFENYQTPPKLIKILQTPSKSIKIHERPWCGALEKSIGVSSCMAQESGAFFVATSILYTANQTQSICAEVRPEEGLQFCRSKIYLKQGKWSPFTSFVCCVDFVCNLSRIKNREENIWKRDEKDISFYVFLRMYCFVPRCSVTFWTHPEIIPVGQFFRRWIKSINQA